ncbi:MAG TPA: hypothetical protein VH349_03705 [Ktedonobacterales bacterium]|jgi:hypothetical protein
MQPSWISAMNLPPQVASALLAQYVSLLQRIIAVERALNVQEWWLLGRAIPEAGQVAEVASLLAVARGELEQALDEQFDWRMPAMDTGASEQEGDLEVAAPDLTSDPAWSEARREEANRLLRMLRQNLPSMLSFAEQLRANAGDAGMPAAALGALGIVQDRLGEAIETLREKED